VGAGVALFGLELLFLRRRDGDGRDSLPAQAAR
jgi:hypothetical protein